MGFAAKSKHEVNLVLCNRSNCLMAVETSGQKRAEGHSHIPRSGGEPQGKTQSSASSWAKINAEGRAQKDTTGGPP